MVNLAVNSLRKMVILNFEFSHFKIKQYAAVAIFLRSIPAFVLEPEETAENSGWNSRSCDLSQI